MNLKSAWEVFVLFSIPIGGGIPAGVVLGHSRGLSWQWMTFLYFISDVCLAIICEAIVIWVNRKWGDSPKLMLAKNSFKLSIQKTVARYGVNPGPVLLAVIAFGLDPMSGRAATLYAGHGFLTGWAISICGDMFFYSLIMVSTLFLNSILGDGTMTSIIIMALMFGVQMVVSKVRAQREAITPS